MKYMNIKKKYQTLDLQLFAGDEGGDDGDDSGEGDDQDDDDSDEDGEDDQDEKRYSQKDMDDAVKKRLAREKRKWQREQQKKDKGKPDGKDDAADDGKGESEDSKERKKAESRAAKAEAKVACYEAGVSKDSVDDVTALARAYMEADEDLDLEDAIEKVVKKYPHFKKGAADSYDDDGNDDKEGKKKSWGQRQSGRGTKKMSGVEKRFYELNPDLKE